MAIFTFVWSWNNLLLPLLVLTNPKLMTIQVGLATVQGSYGIRYADIMASAILGRLPLVIVFLLFQRNIVEGIAGTGSQGLTPPTAGPPRPQNDDLQKES